VLLKSASLVSGACPSAPVLAPPWAASRFGDGGIADGWF
jgi:hypothetical protein